MEQYVLQRSMAYRRRTYRKPRFMVYNDNGGEVYGFYGTMAQAMIAFHNYGVNSVQGECPALDFTFADDQAAISQLARTMRFGDPLFANESDYLAWLAAPTCLADVLDE